MSIGKVHIPLAFQLTGGFIFLGMGDLRRKVLSFLALFTSTGTLLCCALPALIAAVAGGSAVVSLITAFPWLVPLSRYKLLIFLLAGVLLIVNAYLIYRPRSKVACSIAGEGCETANSFSRFMFWVSLIIYSVGFFFAYLAVPLLRWLKV